MTTNNKGYSQTTLILFIVMTIITVGGLTVMIEFQRGAGSGASRLINSDESTQRTGNLDFVNVVGMDLVGRNISGVRFQVRYEGEGKLRINDSFVQIRMGQSIADLEYRDGDLVRDTATGYYTQ